MNPLSFQDDEYRSMQVESATAPGERPIVKFTINRADVLEHFGLRAGVDAVRLRDWLTQYIEGKGVAAPQSVTFTLTNVTLDAEVGGLVGHLHVEGATVSGNCELTLNAEKPA